MTTVAYKAGILAADTAATSKDGSILLVHKIMVLNKNHVYGFCGSIGDEGVFYDYIKDKLSKKKKVKDKYKLSKGFEAIEVIEDRVYWYERDHTPHLLYQPWYAIGRGSKVALAGMCCGLGAKEAVMLAGELTDGTNTYIDIYDMNQQEAFFQDFKHKPFNYNAK